MLENKSFVLFIKAYAPRLGILVFIPKYVICLLICLLYPKTCNAGCNNMLGLVITYDLFIKGSWAMGYYRSGHVSRKENYYKKHG